MDLRLAQPDFLMGKEYPFFPAKIPDSAPHYARGKYAFMIRIFGASNTNS